MIITIICSGIIQEFIRYHFRILTLRTTIYDSQRNPLNINNSVNSCVCQRLYILKILTLRTLFRWTMEEFLRYPLRILTLRTFCTCICSGEFARLWWKGFKFQPFVWILPSWTIEECSRYLRILTFRNFSTCTCCMNLQKTLVIRWKRLPHWSLQPNSVNSYVCRKLPICKNSNPSPNSDNSYVCQGLYILEILTLRTFLTWTIDERVWYVLEYGWDDISLQV